MAVGNLAFITNCVWDVPRERGILPHLGAPPSIARRVGRALGLGSFPREGSSDDVGG
jgi:hypothetical protein